MNSFKINGINEIEGIRGTLRAEINAENERQVSPVPDSSSTQPQSDVIKLSDQAAIIRALVEQAKQIPDVRTRDVEKYRRLVLSGSYDPKPTDIADALLRN